MRYSEACLDPDVLGPWFTGPTWDTWRVVDKAIFGEKLSLAEQAIYAELAGTDLPPNEPCREVWLCFGRRSAKDVKAASLVTYLSTIGAIMYETTKRLTPGERGVVQLLAVDRSQADVCMGYVRAMFEQPILKQLVVRSTQHEIELKNNLAIEITTNDRRAVRGRTVIAVVMDEVAHWRSADSASPDEETYYAIAPSMVTIPNALLIGLSSPYARRGLFYRRYRELYGKPPMERAIFLKAPTWKMNPNLARDSRVIREAYARDDLWAAAEFGAEFRSDLEAFVSRDVIEASIEVGCAERSRSPSTFYVAFVDPAGGSGQDSMTLSIAHQEGRNGPLIQDVIREVRPPFSPEAVVADFVKTLKDYKIRKVTGDRWGGEFVREPFKKAGIDYEPSEAVKSDIYREVLPLFNSKRVVLLDNNKLVNQLVALERRVSRGGKDTIDHPPSGHDDVANASCGAIFLASSRGHQSRYTYGLMHGAIDDADRPENKDKPLTTESRPFTPRYLA